MPQSNEESSSNEENNNDDYTCWTSLLVNDSIIKGLKDLKFNNPTPIQKLAIPCAIRDRSNILGAAETGSGKTLAFGIPMIQFVQQEKARKNNLPQLYALVITPTRELAVQIKRHLDDVTKYVNEVTIGCLVGGLALPKQERILSKYKPDIIIATPGRLWELIQGTKQEHITIKSLRQLPFLVIDEADRMTESGHFEELINIVEILQQKGIAKEKDLDDEFTSTIPSLKRKRGTWNGIEVEDVFLEELDHNNFRSCKRNDGELSEEEEEEEENEEEIEVEEEDEEKSSALSVKRQTLVFSATLTFVHAGPKRDSFKRTSKSQGPQIRTADEKLNKMMSLLGMGEKNVRKFDLTKEGIGKVDSHRLTEICMACKLEEKDVYLYYYLLFHPGRTIIFCNSKDAIRRLTSVLKLLRLEPIAFHSDMDQKRRFTALEKFQSKDGSGLLLASDVAARGLDILGVDHVIHYQVPRTLETYVHRSGRTARAASSGVSLLLVEPKEAVYYTKLCRDLNSGKHFQLLPVKQEYLALLKIRVDLAKQIDVAEHRSKKIKVKSDWFRKMAKEADIDLEDRDDLLEDEKVQENNSKEKVKLERLRHQLKQTLSQQLQVISPKVRLVAESLCGKFT